MIGAIVGDIAGSRFEWYNRKSKQFKFLKGEHESRHPCCFTDYSAMTLAVADAIMRWSEEGGGSYDALSVEAIVSMQAFGRRYPRTGYGGAFRRWLVEGWIRPCRTCQASGSDPSVYVLLYMLDCIAQQAESSVVRHLSLIISG